MWIVLIVERLASHRDMSTVVPASGNPRRLNLFAGATPTKPPDDAGPQPICPIRASVSRLSLSGSIAVCKSTRPHPIRCAVFAIAKIVEGCPANRLMGACGAVLPVTICCPTNGVGRSAQTWLGTRIVVSIPHTVSRRGRSIAEIIKVSFTNRLPRSAGLIEVVEGRVADVGAGT